jgi:hypothetical protein
MQADRPTNMGQLEKKAFHDPEPPIHELYQTTATE